MTPTREPPAKFLELAAAHGLLFEPGDLDRLGRYLDLLLEANNRFNLTAITDPAEAWERHIFDSLTLLPVLADVEAASVIDVGSGGGVPGIPLAICLPEIQFTLLETTGKKADFLRETAEALGLENVFVVNDRAESAGQDHKQMREHFDVVVSRAVGPLRVLLELTVPLARVGGLVVAIKGEKAAAEIVEAKAALHALHSAVIDTIRTPTGTLVVVEKRRTTPRMYPRQPGEPKRKPL